MECTLKLFKRYINNTEIELTILVQISDSINNLRQFKTSDYIKIEKRIINNILIKMFKEKFKYLESNLDNFSDDIELAINELAHLYSTNVSSDYLSPNLQHYNYYVSGTVHQSNLFRKKLLSPKLTKIIIDQIGYTDHTLQMTSPGVDIEIMNQWDNLVGKIHNPSKEYLNSWFKFSLLNRLNIMINCDEIDYNYLYKLLHSLYLINYHYE